MTAVSRGLGGLDGRDVAALVAGGPLDNLTDAEKIAHRLALTLTTSHRVDDDLYRDAQETFGAAGVFEIATLTGIYHAICAILNVFAIPAP